MNNWKKNMILFLASQTVSLFGSSLVQYAIMWFITLKTQSGIMMTISIACSFVPSFFVSPFAGVWADRFSRKKLIIISDLMIAACTLVLAVLFLLGYDMLWLLFAGSAVRAIGSAVQGPAVSAFIPQIVPEDKLMKINAINGSIQSLVMLASPMLSGALLTFFSIEAIFFIDVITAILAVLILLIFLRVPPHAKAMEKQTVSYFADMKIGFLYIKNHAYLRRFFAFYTGFSVLIVPTAFLTPLQVTRSFGDDVWRLTAVELAFSFGMLAGGIVMTSWGGFKNKVHSMALATTLIGIMSVLLGVVSVFWIYLSIMALAGLTLPMFNTPCTVLLQQKVEPDILGRVFSIIGMISSLLMPLGMLVFGPLSDAIKIEWLLIGTGVLVFVQGLFILKSKAMLESGV